MNEYRRRLRHARERRERSRTSRAARAEGSWKVRRCPELGLDLLLNTNNYVDFLIDRNGTYEPDVAVTIAAELQEDIDTFVDVGSHLGLHSLQVSRQFPQVSILSLEPVPANATQQRANMLLNDLEYDLRTLAASDTSEDLTLHLGRRDRGDLDYGKYNSGLASIVLDDLHDPEHTVQARADTLDAMCSQLGSNQGLLVKIDVEGSESRVLSGMSGLMSRLGRISVVVELLFDRWPEACSSIEEELRAAGFGMHDVTGRAMNRTGERRSANYLFKRR